MTLNLRFVSTIFVAAFFLMLQPPHAKAEEGSKKTGNFLDRLADGLNENGTIRDSTNCILCGTSFYCGELEQKAPNGKSIKNNCRDLNKSWIEAYIACGRTDNQSMIERLTLGSDVKNYREIREIAQPTKVLGDTTDYAKLSAVSLPNFYHWEKIDADRKSKPEPRSMQARKINTDYFAAMTTKVEQKYVEQAKSCIENVNDRIDEDYEKQRDKKYSKQTKAEIEKTTKKDYWNLVLGEIGVDSNFKSQDAAALLKTCSATKTPTQPVNNEGS